MPHENVNWAELAQKWMEMKSSQDDEGQLAGDQSGIGYQASFDTGNFGHGKSLFPSVSNEGLASHGGRSNNGYPGSWDHSNQPPPPPASKEDAIPAYGSVNNFEYNGYSAGDWYGHGQNDYEGYEERSQSPGGPMGALPMWPPPQGWMPPSYPEEQQASKEPSNSNYRSAPHPPPFFPARDGPPPGPLPAGFRPPFPPPFGFGGPPIRGPPQAPQDVPMFNMPADQRKKLPAWIREGLEKAEREKQKQSEKEMRIKRAEEEKAKKRTLAGKGKFDSSSEEEDNEADDERSNEAGSVEPVLDVDPVFLAKRKEMERIRNEEDSDDDRTEEEKRDDAMSAMRTIMMSLLLETTDSELNGYIVNAINDAKRKAEPKLLAKSSALAALSNFGDDEDSDKDSDMDERERREDSASPSDDAFKAPIGLPMKKSKQDSPKLNDTDLTEPAHSKAAENCSSTDNGKESKDREERFSQRERKRDSDSDGERERRREKKRKRSRSRERSRDRKRSRDRRRSRSRSRNRDRGRRSRSRDRKRSRSRERRRSRSRDLRRDRSRERDSKKDRRSRSRERKRSRSNGRR